MGNFDPRPISKLRVVGVLFALGAGALAVLFIVGAARLARNYDQWLTAKPTHFAVDLSRVGEYQATFTQTCQVSHGESILLNLTDVRGEAVPDAVALLAGLRGQLEVVAGDGKAVVEMGFPHPDLARSSPLDEGIELAYFHPFDVGAYTLRMQVTEPAPALAGRAQVITARYRLCGLERLPVMVLEVIAVAFGLPAVIVSGFTAIGLMRHGWRRAAAVKGVESSRTMATPVWRHQPRVLGCSLLAGDGRNRPRCFRRSARPWV
jgi:hypothetical protein